MRATLETLGLACLVGLAQAAAGAVGLGRRFALSAPFDAAPWTLVTSVYAHASVGHLLANALALGLVGPLVERRTNRLRFHAFVVATGGLAGVGQVVVSGVVGPGAAVLGLSGAVFALGGYVLTGNKVADTAVGRLSPRTQLGLFVGVAVLGTLLTAAPGVALVAHATGATCGLLAGRARVLDVR